MAKLSEGRGHIDCADRRYHARDVLPEVTNALLVLGTARSHRRQGLLRNALIAYRQSLALWEKAEKLEPGRWADEVERAREELSDLRAPLRPMARAGRDRIGAGEAEEQSG